MAEPLSRQDSTASPSFSGFSAAARSLARQIRRQFHFARKQRRGVRQSVLCFRGPESRCGLPEHRTRPIWPSTRKRFFSGDSYSQRNFARAAEIGLCPGLSAHDMPVFRSSASRKVTCSGAQRPAIRSLKRFTWMEISTNGGIRRRQATATRIREVTFPSYRVSASERHARCPCLTLRKKKTEEANFLRP